MVMPLASLKLFACIAQKEKMDTMMPHELVFGNDALVNTDWYNSATKYVGLLISLDGNR